MTDRHEKLPIIRGRPTTESEVHAPLHRMPWRMRRVWVISFLVWTIPAAAFTVLVAFAPEHTNATQSIFLLFVRQGLPWYFWALLTPFILSLGDRVPVDTTPRTRTVLLHATAGILTGVLFGIVWLAILSASAVPPERPLTAVGALRSLVFFVPFSCGVYATIAAVGYAMYLSRRLREREVVASRLQSQLREAHLGALRMQLQPHFLFNTLNTIAMLVREGEAQTSVRMLARLSDLLRRLLEENSEQEVRVREELEFLGRYLEIEQLRFQDRLRVEMNVEEGTRDAYIPNLVLQPIVENAIKHGISRRAAASALRLNVARENGSLVLSVCDDGPGLEPTFSIDQLTGIGLRNTATRLQYLYGDDATLDVRNAPAHGTIVTVRIPYHESPVSADKA
jgi:signal transduction histidine kinase